MNGENILLENTAIINEYIKCGASHKHKMKMATTAQMDSDAITGVDMNSLLLFLNGRPKVKNQQRNCPPQPHHRSNRLNRYPLNIALS